MRFQVANKEVISSMGVAHVSIQMYGYTFNLPIFVCDLGEIDCIFVLDAGKEAGFTTCAYTDRIWFNGNQHDEPKQLSWSNSNAICHLQAVQSSMSKTWNGSQVHYMTHSSLWADLGTIMMNGIVDLRSGSAELDFVNSTSNPVVIKPCQTVATAIEVDSVKMLPDSEPDDDKSIPSAESVFSCVKRKDEFLYPCIMSDKAVDGEEKEFDLDMDIIEPPLARPQEIQREKGTMLKCVHDLYIRASKNLSPQERAKNCWLNTMRPLFTILRNTSLERAQLNMKFQ